MVTVDDVAGVVSARLAATAAVGTAIPGDCWFGRGPDTPTAYPYAVFAVEPQEPETFSGPGYLQTFRVRVGAYAPVGAAGSDPAAVQQALAAALVTTDAQAELRAAGLRTAGEQVLHARPLAGDAKFEPTLREGRDVFVCGLAVELLAHGLRSAA